MPRRLPINQYASALREWRFCQIMTLARLCLILAFAAFCVLPQAARSQSAVPRMFVVAVGINEYKDASLNLKNAAPDARAIASAFQSGARELHGPVQVELLLNEDATEQQLDLVFRQLANDVQPKDLFVLFVAAHGVGMGPLLSPDADPSTTAHLRDRVKTRRSKHGDKYLASRKLLIFDTCESAAERHQTLSEQLSSDCVSRTRSRCF